MQEGRGRLCFAGDVPEGMMDAWRVADEAVLNVRLPLLFSSCSTFCTVDYSSGKQLFERDSTADRL